MENKETGTKRPTYFCFRDKIDKNILIEKNTIQVNRILKDKEEFELNEDTDLLFENTYLFPFAKYEDNKIIELTEEEAQKAADAKNGAPTK